MLCIVSEFQEIKQANMIVANKLRFPLTAVIKNDQLARNEMERIAEYNYQHFWKHQKNLHIKNTQKMFDDIWGEDLLLYKIYEQLNF